MIKRIIQFISVIAATTLGSGMLAAWAASKVSSLHLFPIRKKWTGSGFLGTLIALLLTWNGVCFKGGWGIALLMVFSAVGIFVSGSADRAFHSKDDPRINVDELIGFYWAVAGIDLNQFTHFNFQIFLVSAFVLFRIFDVAKLPFPQAQELKGGLGVMMDDIAAGIFANLILRLFIFFHFFN